MPWPPALARAWLAARARRRGTLRGDDDFRAEVEAHIELEAARLIDDGVPPDEARSRARRAFGNVTSAQEQFYERRRVLWLEDARKDAAYAWRSLTSQRGFAAAAILTLALGIGANTAVFSVIRGVVLKPLPYTNGERLLVVRQSAPGGGLADARVSVGEFYDYRDRTTSFDAVVEYHQMAFDLLDRGEPDRVSTGVVSRDFFSVLGITPTLGRDFRPADDVAGADAVLILSHSYWQSKFGGDPRIVGQAVQMNDRPHTVIGVLPNVPHYPEENDVYMPVASCPFRALADEAAQRNRRAFALLNVFGRLREGVSREQGSADVAMVAQTFGHAHDTVYEPATSGFGATTVAVRDALVGNAGLMLVILLGTTTLILLTACANVANLAVARLLRRDRELAMRAALGARRGRLIRQLLVESTLLSVAGGAVGLLFAASTQSMLTAFVGRFTSRTTDIGIDMWVLLFTIALSVATGIAFGTIPALVSARDLGTMTRGGGCGPGESRLRRRLQGGLVVAQVATSTVLLAGAGLLLVSFYRLQQVDPGYQADRVLAAEINGTFTKYPDAESLRRLYEPLVARVEQQPGVVAAAITTSVPLARTEPGLGPIHINHVSDGEPRLRGEWMIVTPGYFRTLGIPVLEGRALDAADTATSRPVAIVNATLRRYFADGAALGSRISTDDGRTWRTVVGVVGDVREFGLDRGALPHVYVPLAQTPGVQGELLVRTADEPLRATAMIRQAVRELDPQMPVENLRTLADARQRFLATPQVTAVLLSVFAAVALLVTMAGIAGVMAMHVSQRLREFGVRMALGASRVQVLRPVIAGGLALVGAGLLVGAAAAVLLTPVLSAYLFQTGPTDPVAFGAVAATLLLAALAACTGPAWRATSIDPLVVMRAD